MMTCLFIYVIANCNERQILRAKYCFDVVTNFDQLKLLYSPQINAYPCKRKALWRRYKYRKKTKLWCYYCHADYSIYVIMYCADRKLRDHIIFEINTSANGQTRRKFRLHLPYNTFHTVSLNSSIVNNNNSNSNNSCAIISTVNIVPGTCTLNVAAPLRGQT